jgi:hypothetical protein
VLVAAVVYTLTVLVALVVLVVVAKEDAIKVVKELLVRMLVVMDVVEVEVDILMLEVLGLVVL